MTGVCVCMELACFAGDFWRVLTGRVSQQSAMEIHCHLDHISTPKRTSMYSTFADVCFTLKIHDTCGQICAKSMDCWGSFSQVPIPADSWYPGV